MSTVTAAGWSGLVNDVHGTTYETVGEIPPKDGKTADLMQKRGDMGVAEVAGGVTQRSRAVIDVALATDTDFYKGEIGTRMDATNTQGGVRDNTLVNVVPDIDATGLGMIFDTKINMGYVEDTSGNGGAALAVGTPNAAQP